MNVTNLAGPVSPSIASSSHFSRRRPAQYSGNESKRLAWVTSAFVVSPDTEQPPSTSTTEKTMESRCEPLATNAESGTRHGLSPRGQRAAAPPNRLPSKPAAAPAATGGALMEPSGGNHWQSAANRRGPQTTKTSEIRCHRLPPMPDENRWNLVASSGQRTCAHRVLAP